MVLVANACSTALGLYDPLEEIGHFCRQERIWFHVDGAHGASALLSRKHRHLMRGAELADSLVWDAHKLMRTPTVCAALLVRDSSTLDHAFQQEASYLFHDKEQPGFDFIHRTVECTKAGLGLRLFMVLGAMGAHGLEDYVDRQYELAHAAWKHIRQQSGFEVATEPEANILCFRCQGSDGLQLQIRDRLVAEGEFYLSTAMVNGQRYLRLALMNPDTGLSTVDALLHAIVRIRAELASLPPKRA
jgi:L-2,4-diaminobutyrate decarboxylase